MEKNFIIPVLITTCITYFQILVANYSTNLANLANLANLRYNLKKEKLTCVHTENVLSERNGGMVRMVDSYYIYLFI